MSRRTKKSGLLARFGPRYGSTIKKRFMKVEVEQKKKHVCTRCGKKGVKRVSAGIWRCRFCGHTFAGGAYVPRTDVADSLYKMY